jgi:hypothetical protein
MTTEGARSPSNEALVQAALLDGRSRPNSGVERPRRTISEADFQKRRVPDSSQRETARDRTLSAGLPHLQLGLSPCEVAPDGAPRTGSASHRTASRPMRLTGQKSRPADHRTTGGGSVGAIRLRNSSSPWKISRSSSRSGVPGGVLPRALGSQRYRTHDILSELRLNPRLRS